MRGPARVAGLPLTEAASGPSSPGDWTRVAGGAAGDWPLLRAVGVRERWTESGAADTGPQRRPRRGPAGAVPGAARRGGWPVGSGPLGTVGPAALARPSRSTWTRAPLECPVARDAQPVRSAGGRLLPAHPGNAVSFRIFFFLREFGP